MFEYLRKEALQASYPLKSRSIKKDLSISGVAKFVNLILPLVGAKMPEINLINVDFYPHAQNIL